jgi:hypothetical protein
MQPVSQPTSIVPLPSHRQTLLVFEIRSKIRKDDMEWMAHRVAAAFKAEEKIDLLLIMTNYEGSELGAVFDGDAAAVMMKSLTHVRRYCVVGAPGWARAMIELFKWLTPVEEKTFALEQLSEARSWVDSAS